MPVLDYQVAASADDGIWWGNLPGGGGFEYDDYYLSFGYYMSNQLKVSARFTGVTIPQGAKIKAAYMSFHFASIYASSPECQLFFEKAANPTAVSNAQDGNSRALTTNHIGYAVADVEGWQNTDDISAIIQELVDAYDYSAGSAMQMIVYGGGPAGSRGNVYSYDYTGHLLGPKLHIEYGLGEIGTSSFRGMFRGMFNRMR